MKKRNGTFQSQKGFTLVELMIVVIIIGILTAVGVPLYMGYVRDAKAASAEATMGVIINAEKLYYQFHATFVDVADLSVVPNDLNIDVRNATQYWTVVVSSADKQYFTVTATGRTDAGHDDYKEIKVEAKYDREGDVTWTKWENGTVW